MTKKYTCFMAILWLSLSTYSLADTNIAGTWVNEQLGYKVRIVQNGDKITANFIDSFSQDGVEIVKSGAVDFEGVLRGKTIEARSTIFKKKSTLDRCGGPLLEDSTLSLELSTDLNRLYGKAASKYYNLSNCTWTPRVDNISFKKLSTSANTGACPKATPMEDNFKDISGYIKNYAVGSIPSALKGTMPVLDAIRIAETLSEQLKTLDRGFLAALLIDYIDLISMDFRTKPSAKWTTERAEAIFQGAPELKKFLQNSSLCVSPSGEDRRLFELNFYAINMDQCIAMANNFPKLLVNGEVGGRCYSDQGWPGGKFWKGSLGKNQVTFVVNPRSDYVPGY
jgi:hypothetical protein